MKKFVAMVLVLVAMMVTVSAYADMKDDIVIAYCSNAEQTIVIQQEGKVSSYIELHDEGEHWIVVEGESWDCTEAVAYVHKGYGEDSLVCETTLNNDNAEEVMKDIVWSIIWGDI